MVPFRGGHRLAFVLSFLYIVEEVFMTSMVAEFTQIIETLSEEDVRSALDYVRFLSQSRKKAAKVTLKQIQGLFSEDKGWKSEQEMLADMAHFRRARSAR